MTGLLYKEKYIKFFQTDKNKSRELDFIKQLDQIIGKYNRDENGHYILKLLKAVKRGWF
jgi:hypothetical protein